MGKSNSVFLEKTDDTTKSHSDEIEELYAQIGQLQVEDTFLKENYCRQNQHTKKGNDRNGAGVVEHRKIV